MRQTTEYSIDSYISPHGKMYCTKDTQNKYLWNELSLCKHIMNMLVIVLLNMSEE